MDISIPVDPLAELRRLYRQACVHQFAGETEEAGSILRTILPARIIEMRQTGSADEATLQQVFAEEHRRVADAQLFSELVLPRLQPSLRLGPTEALTSSQPIPTASRKANRSVASEPQSITDMLDSMLAQDSARPGRR